MKRPTFWQWFFAITFLKVPALQLRRCQRLVEQYGFDISFDALVAHHMAGGRMLSWIEGLVYARERGISLEMMNGAARDLVATSGSGITLTDHIRVAERAGVRDMQRFPFDSLQKKPA